MVRLGWALAVLTFAPGIAPTASAAEPPAASAPTDPLASLAADVNAVLGAGGDASLILTETDHGVTATRTLKVGDEYRDGWTIKTIAAGAVTLDKGKTSRTVALTGAKAGPSASAATPAGLSQVAASNALVGGSGAQPSAPRPAALQAAVNSGDLAQVLKLGGTAQDAAAAMAASGKFARVTSADPSTASFVQIGDRYGIAMAAPNGGQMVMTTPDFDGFMPTGPVRAMPGPQIPAGANATFVTNGGVVVRQAITPPPAP